MVRTAVTLLLLLPLLMPPGVCICHVVVPLGAPTVDEPEDNACTGAVDDCTSCGGEDHGNSPYPSNRQGPQGPGWPILKFVGSYGPVKPETPPSGVMLAHVWLASPPETTPFRPSAPPSSPELGWSEAPLFLTLRTLRI